MKRTEIKRRTPVRRPSEIKLAKAPLKKVNRKRLKVRRELQFGTEAFREWCSSLPCVCDASTCGGPVQLAHVRTRAAGGTWQDILPICQNHHIEQHLVGIQSFAERYSLNLKQCLQALHRLWDFRQERGE